MAKGFWKNLKKPFFALAPMADVTDAAFRYLIAQYGKPDIMWTEFVSCDGLCSAGRDHLLLDLQYCPDERPIVVQFFGAQPEHFYQCAELAQELGFDGIDINMGCPDKNVEKQGAGARLILNPELARQIIRATQRGAGKLPVSVKTRIGYQKNELKTWLPELLTEAPDAIILHARTRKELSLVPAHWEAIAEAVEIAKSSPTLIVGNGDVVDLKDAEKKAADTGVAGIMLGRAIFGNPWLFNNTVSKQLIPISEKLRVMVEHTRLFEHYFSQRKNFAIMKKHFSAYVTGFPGARELRMRLMDTLNADQVATLVAEFLNTKM